MADYKPVNENTITKLLKYRIPIFIFLLITWQGYIPLRDTRINFWKHHGQGCIDSSIFKAHYSCRVHSSGSQQPCQAVHRLQLLKKVLWCLRLPQEHFIPPSLPLSIYNLSILSLFYYSLSLTHKLEKQFFLNCKKQNKNPTIWQTL